MNKKEYLKPEQCVIVLQQKAMLLYASSTNTNLGKSDDLTIDDNPTTDPFWGR